MNFLQYRDDTIVESELNDQNPHLEDNGSDYEEDIYPFDSNFYESINKKKVNL